MRRRFFIDENLSPELENPLDRVFRQHKFTSARRAALLGTDDQDLFRELSARRYGAIITEDREQLEAQYERAALRDAGLHWLGVPKVPARGIAQIVYATSVIVPAVLYVLENWHDIPTAYFAREPRMGDHSVITCEAL
ncbi:hypothetical protein G1H11_14060 [Phytoactinopolyspora alkaliphila]|uniref:VapC45 PIN like domain-containing protein n=1 Tax=Phytoactinopolyspora alkaliphila TaxID=1783498 RepID=A0A6N9YND0_9ACTN|nr:hypothetical protein [Phytoactinopolyspora alkaliphila]